MLNFVGHFRFPVLSSLRVPHLSVVNEGHLSSPSSFTGEWYKFSGFSFCMVFIDNFINLEPDPAILLYKDQGNNSLNVWRGVSFDN